MLHLNGFECDQLDLLYLIKDIEKEMREIIEKMKHGSNQWSVEAIDEALK